MTSTDVNPESKQKPDTGVRRWAALALTLAIIFLFNAYTIRQGHSWGDDYAMYVHHAENLAHHHPYLDTGYIYNQREAWYGPRSYPPVFPLLLAPVIGTYGLNFTAMKLEEVAALTLSLAVIYFLFDRLLSVPYRIVLLLILGFNPLFWDMKDSVTSDYPFWLFFLVSVLLIERAPRSGRAGLLWGVLAGVALYLCYGTRSIGLMLLPGFALYELLKYRKATVFGVCAGMTAVALIVVQRMVFPATEGTYADQFHSSVHIILQNIYGYLSVLAFLWPWTAGRLVSYGLFAALTLLTVIGAVVDYRRNGLRPWGPLLLFYIILIVIWPGNQGLRFLLPVVPVYLAYALFGLQEGSERWGWRGQMAAVAVLSVLIAGLYLGDYRKRDFSRIPETLGRPSFAALCDFIRNRTARSDVFVFYRARALSLYTDRPASVYFLDGTPDLYSEQWRYMQKIGTKYVITSRLFEPDRTFLQPVLQQHEGALNVVYKNRDFTMYRVDAGSEKSVP